MTVKIVRCDYSAACHVVSQAPNPTALALAKGLEYLSRSSSFSPGQWSEPYYTRADFARSLPQKGVYCTLAGATLLHTPETCQKKYY